MIIRKIYNWLFFGTSLKVFWCRYMTAFAVFCKSFFSVANFMVLFRRHLRSLHGKSFYVPLTKPQQLRITVAVLYSSWISLVQTRGVRRVGLDGRFIMTLVWKEIRLYSEWARSQCLRMYESQPRHTKLYTFTNWSHSSHLCTYARAAYMGTSMYAFYNRYTCIRIHIQYYIGVPKGALPPTQTYTGRPKLKL